MSEIYGSSGGDSRPDHGYPSFGSSWGSPWRPDYSDYGSDVTADEDPAFDDGYETDPDTYTDRYVDPAELGQGLTHRQYAEHVRYQSPDADSTDRGDTDADVDTILRENDDLPEPRTRQQAARDDTLDETPTLTEAVTAPDGLSYALDAGHRADHPYPDSTDERADQPDSGERSPDAVIGELRLRVADLEEANTALSNGMAELGAKYAQQGESIAELKSENQDLKSENAETRSENAELRRVYSELGARVERLEHGEADRPPAVDTNRELSHAENADEKKNQQSVRGREWTSNEAFGLAAMAGGTVLTGVADYWRYLPGTYAGIAANVLGLGAATVALIRKNKEVRDAAHRSKH